MKHRFLKILKEHFLYFISFCLMLVLIFSSFFYAFVHDFDERVFDVDNVYNHIKELSSQKYNGRLAGTQGNKMALEYIENYFKEMGISPAGENQTYYQQFKSMVPIYNAESYLQVVDERGEIVKKYKIREDYRDYFSGSGKEIKGDLLILTTHIRNYSPSELTDKIIVGNYPDLPDYVAYAADSGAKALLFTDRESKNGTHPVKMKGLVNYKNIEGKGVIFHRINPHTFTELKRFAQKGLSAEINADYSFQLLEASNILGKIDGKNKNAGYVIISAHVDHVGSDFDGRYFPGALDDASGIGMMLELARVIKSQKVVPDKTIIFAGWNLEEGGIQGSGYYAENPIYPLNKTQVIQIDCVGSVDMREIDFASVGRTGEILRSKLFQSAQALGIDGRETNETGSDHWPFIQKNVQAVAIADNVFDLRNLHNIHTYLDDIHNISKENLQKTASVLLSYIKQDIFKDVVPDYLNMTEKTILVLFLVLGIFIYGIYRMNQYAPNMDIGRISIEDIYYSVLFQFLQKSFYYILLIAIVVLMLVCIVNVPTNFDLVMDNGEVYTNLSPYLLMKKSVLYIRNLIMGGFGTSIRDVNVLDIIHRSFTKSMKLLLATLVFSFVCGILKGIFDGYRDKGKGSLRALGTLAAISVPDVLIVVMVQILIVYLYQHRILTSLMTMETIRKFIIPLLCLSVVPSVYISRITSVAIQEEIKKDYIKAAKAKGLSKVKILTSHLLMGMSMKVIDSLPSLLPMIISNLMIVEYFLNYPGVIYMLLKAYKEHDSNTFIGLSLTLGLMYILMNLGFKLLAKIVNPLKREGIY